MAEQYRPRCITLPDATSSKANLQTQRTEKSTGTIVWACPSKLLAILSSLFLAVRVLAQGTPITKTRESWDANWPCAAFRCAPEVTLE